MPVFYRERGRKAWRKGTTLNISKSGVLFVAEGPLRTNAVVRMKMQLPGGIQGQASGELICSGRVVHAMLGIASKDELVLGVAINTYRLSRGPESAPHIGQTALM